MAGEWSSAVLGEVALIQQGKWLPQESQAGGPSPVYGANGVVGYTTSGHYDHEVVALGCRGSCGTLHLAPPQAWIGNNAMALWPRTPTKLLTRFLLLALEHRGVEDVTKRTAQPMISKADLSRVTMPIPSVATQRRVVDLVGSADNRIASQEALVKARRGARWALLVSLLEAHSAKRRLSDVADVQLGKTINPRESDLTPKFSYLRTANVLDGRVSLDDLKRMHFTAADLDKYRVRANDVLVLEGGDAGRSALYMGAPTLYQNSLHRVRAKDTESVPQYLALAVEYAWRTGQLEALCSQTTIKHLPISKFREFAILCPTLAEQQRIVDVVTAAETALRQDEGALAALRTTRGQLLHNLLSGNHRIPETYDQVLG